ncbi:MAG TPA: hypothetical protein VEA69_14940 [Tepidisphaeraceae bacterium]|nr:hypothetical protein [Tepidisphaeraceae bacterium]
MAKWTRDLIVREILRREAAGLVLTSGRKQDVDWKLYQAGVRVFGSWRNAVAGAGLPPDAARAHQRWAPAQILSAIRALARRGGPLRPAELRERHTNLAAAARRVYGSWSKAVVAAGVDPARLRRVVRWTADRIVEEILRTALRNEPLAPSHVRPKSLVEAAAREFGGWAAALRSAGIDLAAHTARTKHHAHSTNCAVQPQSDAVRPSRNNRAEHSRAVGGGQRWNEERVIEAIRLRLRNGDPLNAMAVFQDNRPLFCAAARWLGNWRSALLATGLDPVEHERPRQGKTL